MPTIIASLKIPMFHSLQPEMNRRQEPQQNYFLPRKDDTGKARVARQIIPVDDLNTTPTACTLTKSSVLCQLSEGSAFDKPCYQ